MTSLILLGLVWIAGYVVVAAIWPYAACRRCKGSGKSRSPFGVGWRDCPRCSGRGRRVKLARRVYESARGYEDDNDR
jgi:DnaJ-class molecular chaperone